MRYISASAYAELYAAAYGDVNVEDVLKRLEEIMIKRESGTTCESCGKELWVVGEFLAGWSGCYSCISKENDSSFDFDILQEGAIKQ